MKKLYDPVELPNQGSQDQTRRLYRVISDAARKLDEYRGRASTVEELFTPSLSCQRSRLRDHCERLIFAQPTQFGRKAEELLWRKVFYDVVSTAKRLKKNDYTAEEIAHLQGHIYSGIGHYYHMLMRLQNEYDMNLQGMIDFPMIENPEERPYNKNITADEKNWASECLHRCLIYLGDLSRYKIEIYPNWDPGLAIRYYMQAANFNPNLGVPHNQLGTLSINSNYSLDSAYYYMRCLACVSPFEGAESNLIRLFEKNSNVLDELVHSQNNALSIEPINHIKRAICRFLSVSEILFFDKSVTDLHSLCYEMMKDFQDCLMYTKPLCSESDDSSSNTTEPTDITDSSTPQYLSPNIMFKITGICLLCISKLQNSESSQKSTAVAFTIGIYGRLIDSVIDHINNSVLNMSVPTVVVKDEDNNKKVGRKKRSILKLHRRRKRINSSEDSDISDTEGAPYENSSVSSDDGNSDISELDEQPSSSESDSDEEKNSSEVGENCLKNGTGETVNGKDSVESAAEKAIKKNNVADSVEKVRKLDPNDVLEIVVDEGTLQSIKILSDWLTCDIDTVKSCCLDCRPLFRKIVTLLNLINIDLSSGKLEGVKLERTYLEQNGTKIALPEDLLLKGLTILKSVQQHIDDQKLRCDIFLPKEEALIRVYKLVAFGNFLTEIPETTMKYDSVKRSFSIAFTDDEETPKEYKNSSQNDIVNEASQPSKSEDIKQQITRQQPTSTIVRSSGVGPNVGSVSRGRQLMHSMGQLWLAAEVRDLETRVRGSRGQQLSPYLVLDSDALIRHTYLVKQLVNARKFIVVVPAVVVSALDELKRETPKARDAIRWLESQFQRGNRFLRAQRSHERTAIPLIKYPKKRDKETHIYFQIIECCHFLTQQQKDSSDLVTLLTGNPNSVAVKDIREISFVGLARSAGVTLELITVFHSKWKKSMRNYHR